ncbi:hypothetical protein V2J09_001020 [Rumex salicifolius]
MRGRSYSPSPPRGGYGRRGRSPSPRGRYGGRGRDTRDGPTSLLVRNLRHDCRPEDLRRPFGQFGPLKDIYLPRDYYTGEPRGFGFVQFVEPDDAAEAKYQMDGQHFQGRTLTVVFAEENRKKPTEMRTRERVYDRRRSPPRYSRSPRHSRSPPPRQPRSRSRSHEHYSPSPRRKQYSRSVSPPPDRKHSRERSFSRSPAYANSRSRSRSPIKNRGPSRSSSPVRDERPSEPEANGSPIPRWVSRGHRTMKSTDPHNLQAILLYVLTLVLVTVLVLQEGTMSASAEHLIDSMKFCSTSHLAVIIIAADLVAVRRRSSPTTVGRHRPSSLGGNPFRLLPTSLRKLSSQDFFVIAADLVARRRSSLIAAARRLALQYIEQRQGSAPRGLKKMEEQFILRVPPSVAKQLDRLLNETSSSTEDQSLDLSFSEDGRSGTFSIGDEHFPASLLDLPCILESYKTYDDSVLIKTADIGQMIMVREEDDPVPDSVEYRHGVTPPMRDARRRRFRRESDLNPEVMRRVENDLWNIMNTTTQEEDVEETPRITIKRPAPTPTTKADEPEPAPNNEEPDKSDSDDSDDSI